MSPRQLFLLISAVILSTISLAVLALSVASGDVEPTMPSNALFIATCGNWIVWNSGRLTANAESEIRTDMAYTSRPRAVR